MQQPPNLPTALFTGSFDPFTIGHADIVRRILPMVSRLVIGVGVNPDKHTLYPADKRVEAIKALYANEQRIAVVAYTDLTIDLAHREHAQFIVKGVRSVKDFEYERDQADYNRRLGGIDTLLIPADTTLAAISSSAYRELTHFGKDASWMLPEDIAGAYRP